jgi:hypothetical protein
MSSTEPISIRIPKDIIDLIKSLNLNRREVFMTGLEYYVENYKDLHKAEREKLEKERDDILRYKTERVKEIDKQLSEIEEREEKIKLDILGLLDKFCLSIQERWKRNRARLSWATNPYSYIEHMAKRRPHDPIQWYQDRDIQVTYGQLYQIIDDKPKEARA